MIPVGVPLDRRFPVAKIVVGGKSINFLDNKKIDKIIDLRSPAVMHGRAKFLVVKIPRDGTADRSNAKCSKFTDERHDFHLRLEVFAKKNSQWLF